MVNILSWLLNRRQLNESNERNHVTNEYPTVGSITKLFFSFFLSQHLVPLIGIRSLPSAQVRPSPPSTLTAIH